MNEKEKKAREHLKNTYILVGRLNNNDIKMMENMRENPAKEIANLKVKEFGDYDKQEIITENNEKRSTGLPKSNVLYFDLEQNAWVCVRPSGTEPKIKFYMGVCGSSMENANEELEKLERAVKEMAENAQK